MTADANCPAPLVDQDTDVRDLDGFMLNVERLMASELVALSTGDEFKAAVLLWCRAWKQSPAASLPNDDRVLASFSGAGPKWSKVKKSAMRGFILCSDGRFYHPVIAAEARQAFERKQSFRRKREADAKRLSAWRQSRSETRSEAVSETQSETRFVAEGQGQGQGQGQGPIERKKEPPIAPQQSGDHSDNYAYEGRLIRLTEADFERWRSSFHAIPDIRAALDSLDDFYNTTLAGKDRTKWFVRASAALQKKHQEAKSKPNGPGYGGFLPLGVGG